MTTGVRQMLIEAVRAGCYGYEPADRFVQAISAGGIELPLDQLEFDSLAWMEFCIFVELQSGLELTPADIESMTRFADIEEWIRARQPQ